MSKQISAIAIRDRSECVICGTTAQEALLLPQFPLTGIYIEGSSKEDFPKFDLNLLSCPTCGHAQLKGAIDPEYLYHETYTHRTSPSPISTRGNDFFYSFIKKVCGEKTFKHVFEVGCNDLYLLEKLESQAEKLTGNDPIWGEDSARSAKINVLGGFIEAVDWNKALATPPDLILSVHTYEHIDLPKKSLQKLYDGAAPGATFIIEVPGFDTLLTINRFDQIFHQHLNYYSLASFTELISQLGGEYLAHTFNYKYWLGTMLVAFRKPETKGVIKRPEFEKPSLKMIYEKFEMFSAQMKATKQTLEDLQRRGVPLYGYGAAQMVPALAYHLKTDLHELKAILDENPDRIGKKIPGIQTAITAPTDTSLQEAAVMITALDSARYIVEKLVARSARYIIHPLNLF